MIKPFKGKNPNHEKFFIPRSVQQSIPIKKVHKDGIFEVAGLYSKTWRFFDINYAVAGKQMQEYLFLLYCAFINALPARTQVKITLYNRTMNQQEFEENLLMKMKGDGKDHYRTEHNGILTSAAESSNNISQEKYLTISVERKTVKEARSFFQRAETDLKTYLGRLDVKVAEITVAERMRLFHDFFRPSETQFYFDYDRITESGTDVRDSIAPDYMLFRNDHYEVGNQVGRVLFIREYANFIRDRMITDLADLPRNMMVTINLLPIPTDEVVKEIQRRLMAIESDITRNTQRQVEHNNFNASVPYHLRQLKEQTEELYTDVTERDQSLLLAQVVITHLADNMEQLEQDTESLVSIGNSHGCTISNLMFQQEDGLNTVLPYGLQRIDSLRSLTTESTAVLMPFKAQEIMDTGGIYYGRNAVSGNLIICDRRTLMNGNGFIFGVSGSGKSMAAKQEMASVALNTDDDIIIVDPEREYGPLVNAMGGEVIVISNTGGGSYINAMDISDEYDEGQDPLKLKSGFIMSLFEQLAEGRIEPGQKSIIDRCAGNIYRQYLKNFRGDPPTLKDLYDDLKRQVEPGAEQLALILELFTTGSLDVFAHQTNINSDNRLLCFDIHELGEELKPVGLLVMLDAIYNRVIRNRRKGRYTHVYIDEIYLFFAASGGGGQNRINQYSSEFLYKCWKRFRKYGAMLTGITQNVEECLESERGKFMFGNSEFMLMFNQAAKDQEQLSEILKISDTQMAYVNNSPVGHGLIKVGSSIVPLINDFPKDTELYRLMSTRPGEG